MEQYKGLTSEEVKKSRLNYGENAIEPKQKRTLYSRFLEAFGDPIIKVLLAALAINILFLFKTSDWLESIGIAIAVLLATIVSVISEAGSENAFEKLQQEANNKKARVIRDGKVHEIPAASVVVGDIVMLQAGEAIVADGTVIEGIFSCDQSSLNGESKEAKKMPGKSNETNTFSLLDYSKVFSGTVVTDGEGIIKVTSVGMGTFYGKLADELHPEITVSPLKERLGDFAKVISRFGYTAAFVVAAAYIFNEVYILHNYTNWISLANHILKALTIAVSIIVMAVPEGLPMMITIVLARNMKNMLKDNVLVRKLVGIETAGSLNILFCDKTGTLTNGKLQVAEVKLEPSVTMDELKFALINNCSAQMSKSGPIGGNATDRALLEFAYTKNTKHPSQTARLPFNSTNKFMASQLSNGVTLLKGAPEILGFKNCQLSSTDCRLIAIAASKKPISENTKITDFDDLKLLGIVGLKDTLRQGIEKTVYEIKKAGIDVIMITGDSKQTATEIAKQAGIISEPSDIILTSADLACLDDSEIAKKLPHIKVVARSLPADKSRLVKIAKEQGLVCGMTGDGVNDAPALVNADVGFAMGSGTEVAKEAADIVILDDNLASIEKAICYGRTIFKNIRKFIVYQLTVSMGAVGISIIGPFIGADNPITVIQILWINIVMDTLAGLAFAGEMALEKYMKEKPKARSEKIMTSKMWGQIALCGGTISAICLAFLKLVPESTHSMTAFFALFMFLAIFMSFNARTEDRNLLSYLSGNKAFIAIMSFVTIVQILIIYFGGKIFRTQGLAIGELLLVALLAFLIIPIDLFRKRYVV